MPDSSPQNTEEITLKKKRERDQLLEMDKRGRITIPASVRTRYGIDPEDEDIEYWVSITIEEIEVREFSGDNGGDDS